MNTVARVFSFVLFVIGTGVFITSMLTNYWATQQTSLHAVGNSVRLGTNYGLLVRCRFALDDLSCSDFGWNPSKPDSEDVTIDLSSALSRDGFKSLIPSLGANLFGQVNIPFNPFYSVSDEKYFVAIFLPRVIMLLGAALVAIGILTGLSGFCCSRSSCPWITEGIFYIFGSVAIMTACSIFTAQNAGQDQTVEPVPAIKLESTFSYGYSFYMGWVAAVSYLIAGICAILAGSMSGSESYRESYSSNGKFSRV